MVKTSQDLTPSTPICELSGMLSLCHSQPYSKASKRNATEITDILYAAGIKTVGEFMAHSESYFDKLKQLGSVRISMVLECHTYLNSSGIGED